MSVSIDTVVPVDATAMSLAPGTTPPVQVDPDVKFPDVALAMVANALHLVQARRHGRSEDTSKSLFGYGGCSGGGVH